jgi:hypothetical protein
VRERSEARGRAGGRGGRGERVGVGPGGAGDMWRGEAEAKGRDAF